MRIFLGAVLACLRLLAPAPASAGDPGAATVAVQAVTPTADGRATVVSCSGVLIAPDIVLTAGHCLDLIESASQLAVFAYRNGAPLPRPLGVAAFARHPGHVVGWRTKPGGPEARQREIAADLALLRLATPLAEPGPAALGAGAEANSTIAGVGSGGGRLRRSTLSGVRFASGGGARVGFATSAAPVCGGDSGGPAFANGEVWGLVAALLRAKAGCGTRIVATPVDPASEGFLQMKARISAR
ncbi:trypsin-like serine protease [Hansschlegelia plantiphila]|uniref:Peptidase S1 domain-containing protein n=1 Tax=Hansschlegelia plantiphila TaxID=374655 RepID=A0A9W6J4P8_9HYPH|nr:trypsin-like serine protease [Hansschlegelia plantiphila]GLK69344.1 hypothetical protein GCM10008179_29820 [Hansschlegelia plantiphila]